MNHELDPASLNAVQLEVVLHALDYFESFSDEDVFTCALELYARELKTPLWKLFDLGVRYLGWEIEYEE